MNKRQRKKKLKKSIRQAPSLFEALRLIYEPALKKTIFNMLHSSKFLGVVKYE